MRMRSLQDRTFSIVFCNFPQLPFVSAKPDTYQKTQNKILYSTPYSITIPFTENFELESFENCCAVSQKFSVVFCNFPQLPFVSAKPDPYQKTQNKILYSTLYSITIPFPENFELESFENCCVVSLSSLSLKVFCNFPNFCLSQQNQTHTKRRRIKLSI